MSGIDIGWTVAWWTPLAGRLEQEVVVGSTPWHGPWHSPHVTTVTAVTSYSSTHSREGFTWTPWTTFFLLHIASESLFGGLSSKIFFPLTESTSIFI